MTITNPGVYDAIPFAIYHGDLCDGPSVSASTLVALENRCPAYAWARHYLHPAPVEQEDTDATAFGTAAHAYIVEGPAAFGARYLLKPRGMNFATKAGKEWREAHADKGTIITAEDFEAIRAMARAVADHPAARHAFAGGKPEQTLAFRDTETCLWLKARPDYLKQNLALNYKTTINGKREAWERQAWGLGYHMGAALCVDVMRGCGIDGPLYGFVVQEKEAPYTPVVRVLDDAVIEWGRLQYRAALRTFAACLASGKWPGYSAEVERVGLPAWAEVGLQKRHERGEFTAEINPNILAAG